MSEFFTSWRRKIGCVTLMMALVAIGSLCYWWTRGVLPSQFSMVKMNESELENLVLQTTPIGTNRVEVEKALRYSFRRKWTVVDYEAVQAMSQRHFHVPLFDGDYFLASDFAVVGLALPRVVTIRFLFDRTGQLKDVLADVWDETL